MLFLFFSYLRPEARNPRSGRRAGSQDLAKKDMGLMGSVSFLARVPFIRCAKGGSSQRRQCRRSRGAIPHCSSELQFALVVGE